jgi:hypothetical protein
LFTIQDCCVRSSGRFKYQLAEICEFQQYEGEKVSS